MTQATQTNCPVCGAVSGQPLSYGGYYYLDRKLPLLRCPVCDLQYVDHGLTKAEIDAFYNAPEYFASEYAGGGQMSDYVGSREEQEAKARRALEVIKKFAPSGKLLEIGAAGGYFCALARDRYGYDPYGIELSSDMSEWGRKNLQLDMWTGTIDTAPADWRNFSVAYLGDVLEHMATPNAFMEEIKKQLVPGGLIAIELPFTYNWTLSGLVIGLANLCRWRFGRPYFLPAQHRKNFVKKPPYHLLMFTRGSLKTFLEKHGFEVRYLKIYEGRPKIKFAGGYVFLKLIAHYLTWYLPQAVLGDRCLVVAKKT